MIKDILVVVHLKDVFQSRPDPLVETLKRMPVGTRIYIGIIYREDD